MTTNDTTDGTLGIQGQPIIRKIMRGGMAKYGTEEYLDDENTAKTPQELDDILKREAPDKPESEDNKK